MLQGTGNFWCCPVSHILEITFAGQERSNTSQHSVGLCHTSFFWRLDYMLSSVCPTIKTLLPINLNASAKLFM